MTNYNNLYLHLMAKRRANKSTNGVKCVGSKSSVDIRQSLYISQSKSSQITINSLVIKRDHR